MRQNCLSSLFFFIFCVRKDKKINIIFFWFFGFSFVFFIFVIIFKLLFIFFSLGLYSLEKKTSFERGFNSLGSVVLGFSIHFFFMVFIFVFFDLELIFLFFLIFRGKKRFFLFLGVLSLIFGGFFLEWRIKKLFWLF